MGMYRNSPRLPRCTLWSILQTKTSSDVNNIRLVLGPLLILSFLWLFRIYLWNIQLKNIDTYTIVSICIMCSLCTRCIIYSSRTVRERYSRKHSCLKEWLVYLVTSNGPINIVLRRPCKTFVNSSADQAVFIFNVVPYDVSFEFQDSFLQMILVH